MTDRRIHYKSMFTIKFSPKAEFYQRWESIVNGIWFWLNRKYSIPYDVERVNNKWLFEGGRWNPPDQPNIKAQVKIFTGTMGMDRPPKYWTFRLEYPDDTFHYRIWRTDISLTSTQEKSFNVVVVVSYCLIPGAFVKEPDKPIPFAPSIISNLFKDWNNHLYLGSLQLSPIPEALKNGKGKNLANTIKNENRLCPIIVVRPDHEGNINFDLQRLSILTLGNALIYYLENNSTYEEIEYYLGKKYELYHCPVDGIRIYQPKVNITNPKDSHRHRYFIFHNWENKEELLTIIVQGVLGINYIPFRDYITSIDDIANKEREYKIEELKASLRDESSSELIQLLDEDNEKLKSKNIEFSNKIKDREDQIIELQYSNEDYEKRSKYYQAECEKSEKEKKELRNSLKTQQSFFGSFKALPENLIGVIELIEKAHPTTVVFLEESKKSAEKALYKNTKTAWKLLWAMATILWDLYFDEQYRTHNVDISREFSNQTHFELAPSEGELTKEKKECMRLRKRIYEGREIDIMPHIKSGEQKNSLRVYYYVDNETKKIV